MEVVVKPVLGNEADELLEMSTTYMESLYPSESNHLVSHSELFAENALFIGAYVDDRIVGCVAVLFYSEDGEYGEIKRLFVLPESRNLKLGGLLMDEIENVARAKGVGTMRLETGIHQPASIHLYQRLGYVMRGPFGSYAEDPLSVFMEKRL